MKKAREDAVPAGACPAGVWRLMQAGAGLAWRSASGVVVYALLFGGLVGGLVLPPLFNLLEVLGRYDGNVIVGNYSMLAWVMSGRGLAWGGLILCVSVFLLVFFFAGLSFLFATRECGRSLTAYCLPQLWKRLPEMLRISVRWSLVILGAVLLLAVVPGLGFLTFLRQHDINYYLKSKPAEWWGVLAVSALWIGSVGFLLVRGLLRISLFFPLWARGYGDLRESARASWRLTRGHERRLGLLLLCVLGLVLVVHLLFNFVLFRGMDALLPAGSDVRYGTLAVVAVGILLFALETFVVLCAMVAWISAIWGLLCDEMHPSSADDGKTAAGAAYGGARALRALVLAGACAALVFVVFQRVLRLPPASPRTRALVVAHRGGAGEAPENSKEGYQLAIARGDADVLETDVAMTADGVLILAHDSDLMRQAGEPRKLAEMNWEEMSRLTLKTPQSRGQQFAPVCRLEEMLSLVGTQRTMIIEFKHSRRTPALVSRTVAAVQESGLMGQIVFMSLELSDIQEVQALAPEAKVGYFVSVEKGDFLSLNVDWLAPRHTLMTREVVAGSQARGIPVFAWTVDDPVRIVELLEMGVDGIITNEPRRTRRVVDAYDALPSSARSLLRFRRLWSLLLDRQEFQELINSANEADQP